MKPFKNKTTERMRAGLLAVGDADQTISYRSMGESLGISWEHNNLGSYMGEISEWSFNNYGVLLSALIVKSSDKEVREPSTGFMELAWELKHPSVNDVTFVQDEIKRAQGLCKKLLGTELSNVHKEERLK